MPEITSKPGDDQSLASEAEKSISVLAVPTGLELSARLAHDTREFGDRSFAERMSYHHVDSGIIDNEDAKFKKPAKSKPAAGES